MDRDDFYQVSERERSYGGVKIIAKNRSQIDVHAIMHTYYEVIPKTCLFKWGYRAHEFIVHT